MNNTFQNTNYYNDIMNAYNAGISNNTVLRDNLIRNLNNSLNDSCKAYTTNPNIITNIDPVSGAEFEIDLDSYIGKYKNNIEFSNSLREQLLRDEETYFVNRYGSNLYNYLIVQREQHISQLDSSANISLQNTICENNTSSERIITLPGRNPSLNPNSPICGSIDPSGNFIETPELCNDNAVDFYKKFSKYLPYINPDTTIRKIEYRDTEHDFLMKINSLINIAYYILFIFMIILLIGGKKLELSQRAPIYIFLLLLPLLYPYFYQLLYHIYKYFTDNPNIHGPKNAFLDTNEENSLIDAYNM